jgi:RNA polymerase primary sigma factor
MRDPEKFCFRKSHSMMQQLQQLDQNHKLLRLYFREISGFPLLNSEEEKELGVRSRAGDLPARQKLTESNLRFVISVAKKFSKNSDQFLDLINAGNVGLIQAAIRFDPDRNVRFTTYAIWWIRQRIFQQLMESTFPFRISPKTAKLLNQTRKALNKNISTENLDWDFLLKEVASNREELITVLQLIAGTSSLNEPISEGSDVLLQDLLEQTGIASPEERIMSRTIHDRLIESMHRLKPTEELVLRMRFGFDDCPAMTLKHIAEELDISKERVRQIQFAALKKLREQSTVEFGWFTN